MWFSSGRDEQSLLVFSCIWLRRRLLGISSGKVPLKSPQSPHAKTRRHPSAPASRLLAHAPRRVVERFQVARLHPFLPPGRNDTTNPHHPGARLRHTAGELLSGTSTRLVAHLLILFRWLGTRPAADQPRPKRPQEASVSLLERLHRAQAAIFDGEDDPWRRVLERALPANLKCTSTVALLALLDFPATTGNARRLARTMKSMGWVGIKSRRMAPGGWRTTECRGWSRPSHEPQVRQPCGPVERYQDGGIQK